MHTQQHSTHSIWGSPACGYHKVLLASDFVQVEHQVCVQQCPDALHFLWMGQSYVQVLQHFAISIVSLGEAAPCEHPVAPYYLYTFSVQMASATFVISARFLGRGAPCVHKQMDM